MNSHPPGPAPPRVSVLMPAYNARRYVGDAVRSVLAQTFGDFELVAVDDGSTDGTAAALRALAASDPRVRVLARPNTGIVGALNDGLAACRGELVARMDADDLALPGRFAAQVDYLDRHPECAAVGGMALTVDADGDPLAVWSHPTGHEAIDASNLAGRQALIHPTLLARRRALEAVGGYRPESETCEDLDLYLRLAERGRLANLPDVVLHYRRHATSISHARRAQQRDVSRRVLRDARARRALPELPPAAAEEPEDTPLELHRSWAWMALKAGHVATARKHARAALRLAPFSAASWRAVYCTLRGR